jgi:hypothetical protein
MKGLANRGRSWRCISGRHQRHHHVGLKAENAAARYKKIQNWYMHVSQKCGTVAIVIC